MRHCDNFMNTHVMEELSEGHQKPCDTSLLKKREIKAPQKEDYRKHKERRQKTDRGPDRADGGTVE